MTSFKPFWRLMNLNSQKIYPTNGYEQLKAAHGLMPNPRKGYSKIGRPLPFYSSNTFSKKSTKNFNLKTG